jgi:predicted 2-oxoglutarate/Fe(II)-dependent dioxygenase YbiX
MAFYINGLFLGEISSSTTVGGCIDIFEDIWPNPEETIKNIENQCSTADSGMSWVRAETIGKGVNQNARTNYNLDLTSSAKIANNLVAQDVHNQYYTLLLAATNSYAKKYGFDEPMFHESYNVLRYRGGQEYTAHYDGGTNTGRAVSAILYLNSEFEGGEIEFTNFKVKIKPQPGMLIIFPSNYAYTHIAHPVTSGTKYAIVTWIKDRML